jgi:cephalosporin-C deacetylase-like acetyl esterase
LYLLLAGVQPEKLAGYPEPADFDAFWQRQKARLAAVPVKAELKEVPAKKPGFKVYDVKVDCAGGKPVSGYLSVPENAQPKSLGAQVCFHGYGVGGADQQSWPGMIVFDINAHGIENGREPAYYKALQEGELKGYAFNGTENAKPETAYFSGMMLRVMRALEYVKTRPEWNGKTLVAAGGSQGGLQAITAAALDRDVTQCNAFKPWCCDLGGIKLNRLRGWRPDYTDGLAYYDTATMGKRITCPTSLTTGLGDYVCPPSGVSVLYNTIKAPKSVEFMQGSSHGYNPPNPVKQTLSSK